MAEEDRVSDTKMTTSIWNFGKGGQEINIHDVSKEAFDKLLPIFNRVRTCHGERIGFLEFDSIEITLHCSLKDEAE